MTKAAEITALDYPECVRLTPGMYVPSKTHLIYELTDNAVDEHIAGYCDRIDVVVDFNNDICSVEDNGRGMPIDPMKDPKFEGQCQAEVAYTCLHAGGKFKGKAGSYDAKTGGLHGVGAAVVNALSQNLAMFIKKSDHDTTYCLEFETGITTQKLFDSGEKILDKESGTKVVFKPDSTLWEEQFDIDDIKRRLKQTAYLNPKLTINLTIISGEDQSFDTYHFEDGISDFIKDIALENESNIIIEPIKLSSTINDVDVDISLAYTDSFTQELRSFCNCISTTDGGSHENGFKDALGKTVSKIIDDYNVNQKKKISIKTEDTREGMIAIVSVRVKSPTFDGQSKSRLKMLPVQRAVNETVSTELFNYLDRNPNIVKLLIDKIHLAAKAREAATRARENTRNAKQINSMDLSGKLADCLSKEPELCEIYIVEGDSAGGSAKQGRCRETQAILPIFGKIQNTQDCTFNKVINNDKIKLLIAALKCGIGKEYIYENLRYHKIILMSDADEDGGHIVCLYITFFFKYMPDLIEKGHVYIANPPLFKVTKGKQIWHLYNETQLEDLLNEIGREKVEIQRYKGLGEMNSDELWETTMNPETRILTQLVIEDAEEIAATIEDLMGDDSEPRKELLQEAIHEMDFADLDL